jgi:hypothetical protein
VSRPRTDFPEPVPAQGSVERAPHGSGSRCPGQLPAGRSTVGSNGGEVQTCIQCWSEADCWSFDQECCSVWWLPRPRRKVMGRGVRAWHAGAVPTTLYATLAPEQIHYCAAHCAAVVAILQDRDLAKRWQELREGLPALRQVVVLEGAADLTGWERVLGWDELLARGRDALAADPALAGRRRAGAARGPGDAGIHLWHGRPAQERHPHPPQRAVRVGRA